MADPVETAEFQDDPCLSLTDDQADELGVGHPGKAGSAANGKSCEWKNTSGGLILVLWSDTVGLDGVYAANDRGDLDVFEPLPDIGGLPAVAANQVDKRETGACTVYVGTADQVRFGVALQQSGDKVGGSDPCDVAADVAGRVLTTVKGG